MAGNVVRHDAGSGAKLYQANGAIPANTAFAIGVSGATWAEYTVNITNYGFFDDGNPFDNQSSFNTVFNPEQITLKTRDVITISYQVPGEVPPDTFIVEANTNKIGGKIHIISSAFTDAINDKIAFTTFNRTNDQSLFTQRVTDSTISLLRDYSNLPVDPLVPAGAVYPGFTVDGINNPPLLTTYNSTHSLVSKNPLQQVVINGTGITEFDNKTFYVSTLNYKTGLLAPDTTRQVYLYNTPTPDNTSSSWDNISSVYFKTTARGYMQLIDAIVDISIPWKTPLQLKQPPGYVIDDVNRLMVSVIPKSASAQRQYISPSNLKLVQYNNVSTLILLKAVNAGDEVLVTSMVPQASPGERRFRMNSTWNTISGMPNDPVVYRENEFTRTYIKSINYENDEIYSLVVKSPYDLVATSSFTGKSISYDTDAQQYYVTVDGVVNTQVVNVRVYNSTTKAELNKNDTTYGWSWVSVTNLTTIKVVFKSNLGFKVDVKVSAGNSLLSNGEIIKYKSIDLDYSSVTYGEITGVTRGALSTGTSVISQYDIVQSILPENKLDTKYSYSNWYDNNQTIGNITVSGNVYSFNYAETIAANGQPSLPLVSQISTNNIVSFGNLSNGLVEFKSGSFTANIVGESTNGIYIFDISDLREIPIITDETGNHINSAERVKSTSTRIVGLSADPDNKDARHGTAFTIMPAGGSNASHLIKHDGNSTFRVIDSYVDSGNSNQWIIEAATPDSVVANTATFTFTGTTSNTMVVTSSSQGVGNKWNLEIVGGPSSVTADTRLSAEYKLGLPLQVSNSVVATFLNQQFR